MKLFDATDWYWIVGGDTLQVYSSKVGDFVPTSDPIFLAWKSDDTSPTRIDSATSLGDVLSAYQMRPTPVSVLDGYTTAAAKKTILLVEFRILFNHENRLRAIERALGLNGSPANLTQQQALNAVKGLM